MAGIANDVKQIRQALYGREVREAIAHGIEQCYSDVTASKTVADTAAAAANTATQNAQTATQQANQARDNAQAVADGVVNQSITAINDAAAQQRQSVNDLGDQLKDYLEDHYGETTDKVAAKANRSSISAVKHAVGADGQLTLTDALNEPAKKMTIHLEPKQDLHGYDKPWVGGAGKNLLPLTLLELKAANTSGTWSGNNYALLGVTFQLLTDAGNNVTGIKVTGTVSGSGTNATLYLTNGYVDSSNYNECIANGCPANGSGSTYSFRIGMGNGSWQTDQKDNGSGVTINAQSYTSLRPAITIFDGYSIASSGLIFYPMIRLATETDPTYEPYSNICPIEGFDAVEVTSNTKNLLPYPWSLTTFPRGINFIDNGDGSLTVRGTNNDNSSHSECYWSRREGLAGAKLFLKAGQYVFRGFESMKKGGILLARTVNGSASPMPMSSRTFTLDSDDYIQIGINVNVGQTVDYTIWPMLCSVSDESTNYEPYSKNTVSVNLVSSAGSTVYGGTVTVNEDGSGTLVVDRVKFVCEDNEDLTYSTSTFTFYHSSTRRLPIQASRNILNVGFDGLSSKFRPAPDGMNDAAWRESTDYLVGYATSKSLRFKIPCAGSDTSSAANIIAGMEIVYKIAEPRTYNLTAAQLQTLAGTNHVWTDGTNIELDYYGDKYCTYEQVMELIANALKS